MEYVFRLFDFNVYNEKGEEENASVSSGEDMKSKTDNSTFLIQMFGVNEQGETCSILVDHFQPFFYIKVDDHWTTETKNKFLVHIKEKIGAYFDPCITDCKLVKRKKLYGFDGGKEHKFVKFEFSNMNAFHKTKNLWYTPYNKDKDRYLLKRGYPFANTQTFLYESNIPPLLRFFHIQDISPSGWVALPKKKLVVVKQEDKKTSCLYEFTTHYKDIVPLNNKETRVPFKICSFDIEASSSHGDFPVPVKSYKKLATNIVDFFVKTSSHLEKPVLFDLVLNAFGFSENYREKLDLVYPKTSPSKKQLQNMMETWFQYRLETDTLDTEEATIESMFEKKHKLDAEEEEDDHRTFGISGGGSVSLNKSVVDVLQDKTMSRECKIQWVNVSLNRCFPSLEGDKVTFIGSTFLRYGEKEPYKNHCVVLNTCTKIPNANVEIESYGSEREVLIEWKDMIQREDPDIVIGYNIFGFDYEFMFQRAQENNCCKEFLQLSRNREEVCGNVDRETGKLKIEETSIHIASGQHDLKFIKMNGRLQVDLYNFFRREENLSSYKLDYVAGYFIGDVVKQFDNSVDAAGQPVVRVVSNNLTGLQEGSFLHLEEIGHTTEYYNQGEKFLVVSVDKEKATFVMRGHIAPDASKKTRWCLAKDDVTPKDIFRMTNGTADDRAVIAKYCIQDCNLVHHLMNKADILTGFTEMAKICSVPMNFLVMRGQGIKLTSYIAKKCREKGTLMPVIEKGNMDEGYEGAIVLDPKCDLYLDNPVACVDYASLYPSSMISENLSHDSKVWTQEYDLQGRLIKETGEKGANGEFVYDNLPGQEYVNITYDTYKYVRKTPSAAAEKVICGKKTCRFAQGKAIMPSILEELLKARKATRKLIPLEQDEFMKNVLDKRQMGYKVTANSLYGQCGAKTSTFYEKDIAACTTATGRMLLTYAKKVIEECYGDRICQTSSHGPVLTKAEYIYGDSVASDTPVLVSTFCQGKRQIDILSIENLAEKYGYGIWKTYNHSDGCTLKEVCHLVKEKEVFSWTETGWTRVEQVIRHKLAPHKKMVRIVTDTGLVDVTDDHSLLNKAGDMVSPKQVQIGTELLHKDCFTDMRECPWLENVPFVKRSYSLERRKHVFYEYIVKALGGHSHSLKTQDNGYELSLSPKENELAAEVYFTAKNVFGFNVKIDLETTKYRNKEIYYDVKKLFILFDPTFVSVVENANKINTWKYLDPVEDIFVYDLTTANHHFAAGVGSLIVHNTDSVFFTFNLHDTKGQPIRGKEALEITIELAQEAGHLASSFLKGPHDLEYEKTFMPFCLLSKKRYVGMLYETDPNKGKRKEMGIVLKRRDNAPIVKDIYGGIIDILMKEQNVQKAVDFLRGCLRNMVEENYPMEKLIISKSLQSHYKNPQTIAHKVLADRMTARDPGNKPSSGDRIPFVYIINNNKKALQGEKIETPAFVLEKKLKLDYSFYITNQIMKPVQQLFALVIERIWKMQNKVSKISKFKRDVEMLKKSTPPEKWDEKIEQMKNKEVKALLFDEFLRETNNERSGNQSMTQFFSKKS